MAPLSFKTICLASLFSSLALSHELKCSYGDATHDLTSEKVAYCAGNYIPFSSCIKTVVTSAATECGKLCLDYVHDPAKSRVCRGAMYNSQTQYCELYEDDVPGVTTAQASDASDTAIFIESTCAFCGISNQVRSVSDCTTLCTKLLQSLKVTTEVCSSPADVYYDSGGKYCYENYNNKPCVANGGNSNTLPDPLLLNPFLPTGSTTCQSACSNYPSCKDFFTGDTGYCYLLGVQQQVASSSSVSSSVSSSSSSVVSSNAAISSSSNFPSSYFVGTSSIVQASSYAVTTVTSSVPSSNALPPTVPASIPVSSLVSSISPPSPIPSNPATTSLRCGFSYTTATGARYDIVCNGLATGTVLVKRLVVSTPVRPTSACQAICNNPSSPDFSTTCPIACTPLRKRGEVDKRLAPACGTITKEKRQLQTTTFANCIASCDFITGCQSVLYNQGLCSVFTCVVTPPSGYAAAIKITDQFGNLSPRPPCPLTIAPAGSNGATQLTTTSDVTLNVVVAISADVSITLFDTSDRGVDCLQGKGVLSGANIKQDQSIAGKNKSLHVHSHGGLGAKVHSPGQEKILDCQKCFGYTGPLLTYPDEHEYQAGPIDHSPDTYPALDEPYKNYAPKYPVGYAEKSRPYNPDEGVDREGPADIKQPTGSYSNGDESDTTKKENSSGYKGPQSSKASNIVQSSEFGLVIGTLILGMCL